MRWSAALAWRLPPRLRRGGDGFAGGGGVGGEARRLEEGGAGRRRASRTAAATSFAGAVTAIVSPLIWAAKYSRKSASERGITEAGVPNRRATSAISW